MKRIMILILLSTAVIACKKSQTKPQPQTASKIAGKWTILSVTTIALDSTGAVIAGKGNVYTAPPGEYFQFNADGTWTEQFFADTAPNLGITGNYTMSSDTSFTLTNAALPASPEVCDILTISASSMVFSHQRTTKFNGITPGYLKYVFNLSRS